MLFADLVGFTALSEARGAEHAYAVVTGCLQLLDGIARRHGGAIDKYLGDSLMAVFGYPVPMPEPSRAAVQAALEMRERVDAYNRELGLEPRLEIHVGVNTGPLVAGDIRGPVVREFHVLGDCVNVAARLKAKSPLGGIYVGSDTHDECAEGFVFETLEPLALKGKSRPVPAYQVVASRRPPFESAPGSGGPAATELFGRRAERERLRNALAALADGRGGVVTLFGEEGLGKTRLLDALGEEEALLEAVRCVQLRPPTAGESAPRAALAGLLAVGAAAESVAPPTDAALEAELDRLVADRPLLLVIDGVQALGPESLAWLEAQLPKTARQPLLLLLTGRPGEGRGGAALRAAAEAAGVDHAAMDLGPLAPEAARRLLDAVAGEALDEGARALVEARAAGHPAKLVLGAFLAPALGSEAEQAEGRGERSADAERRRATILFADITGFTAMTEKLGAEAAYPIVAGALALLDRVAREHGGTVDKYMGDCVMALFGVPEAMEDAPRAALNAAIAMRHRIRDYNEAHGLELRLDVHTGIHTGVGIAGDISGPLLREFAVMGEPVEVASHLTDCAEAGQVFVGPETRRATRDRFEFAEQPPIRLEGRSGEIASFELLSDRQQVHRGRLGSERQLFSELVGREAEVARMEERLQALSQGQGSVVCLEAEAGLGKSRLAAEMRGHPAVEGLGWVEGRSLSNGAQLSYHPFADLIRQWCGIDDEDDDRSAAAKLRGAVAGLLPEDVDEVFPFVASVLGMRIDAELEERVARIQGDAREKRIRSAVTELLRAGAQATPTVVVMDDLHWADQSSLELLESVLDLAAEHAVLFLLLFRPGFAATSGRIREQVEARSDLRPLGIELRPLDGDAARRMLGNLFRQGDIPQRSRAAIEEKAQGNPFYIEEVVRALVDDGAVEIHEGRFRATERIHDFEIPGTIQEVVMARVDRLPLALRQRLQHAAVIGQSFHQAVLEALVPGDDVSPVLDALVDAEFLVPSDRLQGIEFAFKHPLLQEVTYDGILESRREELHHDVAEAIEARLPDTTPGWVGMLAYHYGKGGDLAQAEEYLFRAGDEAARVAASSEALHFFREASRLYIELHGDGGDPAKRATLEKNVARALYNRGQLVEAEQHFNQALEHLGQKVPQGDVALMLGAARNAVPMLTRLYVRRPWRRLPAATDAEREAFELMLERGLCEVTSNPTRFVLDTLDGVTRLQRVDPHTVPVATRILAGASTIFSYGGLSFDLSRRCLDQARQYVREDDPRSRMMFGLTAFLHHCFEGDWSEEHEVDEALVEQTLADGLLWDAVTYLGTHADQQIAKGNFARARGRMEQLAKIRDQYDHDLAKSTHYALTMFLALEEQRWEDATAAADVYFDDVEEDLLHVHALGGKARARVLCGDLQGADEALALCEQIVEKAGRSRVPPYQMSNYLRSQLLRGIAGFEVALAADDARGAARWRRRARRSVRPARSAAARCAARRTEVLRLAGDLAWLEGDARGAVREWEASLAEGARLGARPELSRTHAGVAERLAGSPDHGAAVGGLDAEGHRRRAAELRAAIDPPVSG